MRKSARPAPTPAALARQARGFGARSAKVVRASSIATAAWVRLKCRYGCSGYGTSLCCPPNTPTAAEMREVLDGYDRAVLFESRRCDTKKIAVRLEREAFLGGWYKALGLGAGPCSLCRQACSFDDGCRHPEEARPSLEACGIDVFATARANGFTIEVVRDERDEPTYFGVVLLG